MYLGGGIYVTSDGGRTWRCVLDRDQHVYDVTIATSSTSNGRIDRNMIYVTTLDGSVWHGPAVTP